MLGRIHEAFSSVRVGGFRRVTVPRLASGAWILAEDIPNMGRILPAFGRQVRLDSRGLPLPRIEGTGGSVAEKQARFG